MPDKARFEVTLIVDYELHSAEPQDIHYSLEQALQYYINRGLLNQGCAATVDEYTVVITES